MGSSPRLTRTIRIVVAVALFCSLAPSGTAVGQDFLTPATVRSAADARNIDAALEPQPRFHGRVFDGVTDEPLEGIEVRAYEAEEVWDGQIPSWTGATTNEFGEYEITGVTAGVIYVLAFVDLTDTYRDLTYPGRGFPLSTSWGYGPAIDDDHFDMWMYTLEALGDMRVKRVSASDRYQTAIRISRQHFSSAEAVVVASGESFPDALSAAPLAGSYGGPLLLTPPTAPAAGLEAEIRRLGASRIFIVGGTSSVSKGVADRLAQIGPVTRIAGRDRYETAARVARRFPGEIAFLCRGDDFPDALSAAPFAYMYEMPILLTEPDRLPAATESAWRSLSREDDRVLVVGSSDGLKDAVLQRLADTSSTGDLFFARLGGASRYETSARVVELLQRDYDMLGLATGVSFPDALSGGMACGWMGGGLLLTEPDNLRPSTRVPLSDNRRYLLLVEAFGGEGAISAKVLTTVRSTIGRTVYDIDAEGNAQSLLRDPEGLPSPGFDIEWANWDTR